MGGVAEGELVEYLPAFILWALNCPDKHLEILEQGGEKVSEFINPDTQIRTNPIKVWVLENLEQDKSFKLPLGNSIKDTHTLYGSYSNWADKYKSEIGIVRTNQFGSLLLDVLLSMNWNVSKKRIASGSVITGIRFRETPLIMSDNVKDSSDLDFKII